MTKILALVNALKVLRDKMQKIIWITICWTVLSRGYMVIFNMCFLIIVSLGGAEIEYHACLKILKMLKMLYSKYVYIFWLFAGFFC